MRIERLTATNVRNLIDVSLEPAPHLNLFEGINASGKTALLEAIYLLARGRSFRSPRIADVVHRSAGSLQVSARVVHREGFPVTAGIERGEGHLVLRYNGEPVRTVSAHARRFPLVIVTPDSQQLVLGGPALRRDWLDWAMFHVEPSYLEHWRDYHRALRQRNQLLRDAAPTDELRGWEEAIGRSGSALLQARQRFLKRLDDSFQRAANGIWPVAPTLRLKSGWDETKPLEEQLAESRGDDLARGFTRAGPHRADVIFSSGEAALGATFSRGESKLFICLLMMAEAVVLAETLAESPVLLVDDFGAELDHGAQVRLLELLAGSGAQVFLTTTASSLPGALPEGSARFHVEHGKFTEVIQ